MGERTLQEMISDFLPQHPVTEGAVGSMEPVVQVKGCNGPAGPTINWAAFERNAWRQKCERLEAERAVLLAGVEELRLRIFALEAIVEVNRHTRDKGESDDRDAALLRAVKQM